MGVPGSLQREFGVEDFGEGEGAGVGKGRAGEAGFPGGAADRA